MPPVHDEYTSEDLVQIRDYVKGLGQENSGSITSFDSQSCQDYKPLPKKIDLSKVEEISDTQAMGLLTHYCSQCHQAGETWPPSIDLENVNGLRGNPLVLSHIRQAKMPDCSWVPKNGVPSNEERAKLIKWLGQ